MLEPECAAIAAVQGIDDPAVRDRFVPGAKLMTLDLGGGTCDVTLCEVRATEPLQLRELMKASGGPWGGTAVDAAFEAFVGELLGPALVGRFNGVALRMNWEARKRASVGGDATVLLDTGNIAYGLPQSVDWHTLLKAGIARFNAAHPGLGDVTLTPRGDRLKLPPALVLSFFEPVVAKIVRHAQGLLAQRVARGPKLLLLAGSFSECGYVQAEVTRRLAGPDVTFITPARQGLLVVKGAVYFGLYPTAFIGARVARYSYGVIISARFDATKHRDSPDHVTYIDGVKYPTNVLDVIVVAGSSQDVDAPITHTYVATVASQLSVTCRLCVTDLKVTGPRALYEGDGGIKRLGHVTVQCAVDVASPVAERSIKLDVYMGRSEISLAAVSMLTGEHRSATMQYPEPVDVAAGAFAAAVLRSEDPH